MFSDETVLYILANSKLPENWQKFIPQLFVHVQFLMLTKKQHISGFNSIFGEKMILNKSIKPAEYNVQIIFSFLLSLLHYICVNFSF